MKKGYKLCPYCGNEIKEGAIKCQYCKEFLKVEKPKKVEIKEDKTEKKVKKEKVEPKKSKKKQENKINYSSIGGTIKNIFSDFGELLKVIFSAGENRISLGKGITLYLFGMLLIAGFMCLLALPFGEKPFESGESNVFTVLTATFFIVYLRGYLAPKRAMDHGQPRYVGIIPIVNAFYFLTSGDKGDNQYGEKPSILRTLGGRWYDKKDNKNISKYGAIILLILITVLCCLLLSSETKTRNSTNYNTNSIIDRPSILDEPYIKSEYSEQERDQALKKILSTYNGLPKENINISSVDDLKNIDVLNERIENCKTYKEDSIKFIEDLDTFFDKYYYTDKISFKNSPTYKFQVQWEVFGRIIVSPMVDSCVDYYSYLISIQDKFEINDGKTFFYTKSDFDTFNQKGEERITAYNKFLDQGDKHANAIQDL